MKKLQTDVAILGAGASGLMCAATASARGRQILVLDHAKKTGRKILISGGGKCNITNLHISKGNYVGKNPDFTRSALAGFPPEACLDWLQQTGITFEEREHGQIFCKRSASEIVRLLLDDCQKSCQFLLGTTWQKVVHNPSNERPFRIITDQCTIEASSLVIALGSPAWPQVGATNAGYVLARQFGHTVVPPEPALTGLQTPLAWQAQNLAGISIPVTISLVDPTKKSLPQVPAKNLPMLFTHTGISGPATLQTSLYWQSGFDVIIDFLPHKPIAECIAEASSGKVLLQTILKKFLPEKLIRHIIPAELINKRKGDLSRYDTQKAADLIHAYSLPVRGTERTNKAEVMRGGVATDAISSKTFESRLVPGLFFCGEVLDITGQLGGYNIHWAFASGRAAGTYA